MNSNTTQNWQSVKFKKILCERKERALNDGKYPLYSLTIEDGVSPKSKRYEREFLVRNTNEKTYKIVCPGDIVFNPANLRWGAIARAKITFSVLVSPIYEILYPKDTTMLDPIFLEYLTKSDHLHLQYLHYMEGTLVERTALKIDNFLNLSVNIPPLPEQKKIASILTSVDEVIEKTQSQIDKLQDLKKGTMNELLTKGISHTEFKESELGRIPKSWEVKRLKSIGECVRGLTYSPTDISNHGLLVLRSSNIQNNRLDFDDSVYVNLKIADRFKTKENDILICVRNGSRQLIGKNILIEKAPINSTHGAFMTVFRSNINLYVQYLMQSDLFYRYVSRDIGATINSINNGNLIEYQFSFPPIEEQNNIISILSSIDKNILQTKDKLLQIQSLKKSLMQDLLTGKVRVTVN